MLDALGGASLSVVVRPFSNAMRNFTRAIVFLVAGLCWFTAALFLAVFAWSLFHPPTVVERIARATTPDVPPEAAPYLRRVTIAWSVFFVCNGAAALFTAMETSFATWTFYNGFLAYVLIALMFGAEFLARQRAMKNLLK